MNAKCIWVAEMHLTQRPGVFDSETLEEMKVYKWLKYYKWMNSIRDSIQNREGRRGWAPGINNI